MTDIPEQSCSGGQMLVRWALSCGWDYAILTGLFASMLWGWPGKESLVEVFGGMMVALLLYHPLGEGMLGGTPGQRFWQIRLITPGRSIRPTVDVVIWRQIRRLSMVWGVISALGYWAYWAQIGPGQRTQFAEGSVAGWSRWNEMFIER